MTRFALLAACAALAACATPQERCVRDISREYNTVTRLIGETELNLARGFRYETEVRNVNVGFTGCVGRGRYYGGGVRFCGSNDTRTVQRAVPIDPVEERRKLQNLKSRQASLAKTIPEAQAACAARYPA